MMQIKIKSIEINGIRGIHDKLELWLDQKSILLYGDNGTGKSSISDSLEWFYTGKVRHLSSSEIDLKDALRNSSLSESENSFVNLTFNKPSINGEKKLLFKQGRLNVEDTISSDEFDDYISKSVKENLCIRYQALTDFIDRTKTDKLKDLSEIIGFSDVTKTKDILKKAFNSLKTEINSQNFEGQVNTQKQILIDKIGANVSQELHLFEKINELIKPLNIGFEVKSIKDIDAALNHIKNPINSELLSELKFLENCRDTLTTLKNEIDFIDMEYQKYYTEFEKISNDVQSIMQIFLAELLKAGSNVIVKKYHKEDSCPLCLQKKNLQELKREIGERLLEIEESSKKKIPFDNSKKMVADISKERLKRLEILISGQLMSDESNSNIDKGVKNLGLKLTRYQEASNEKVTSGNKIATHEKLRLNDKDFIFVEDINGRITKINEELKNDNSTVLYSIISAAKDSFSRMQKIEAEKEILLKQKDSLEIIYNEFVKKQKEALETFINFFSSSINEFYQYMNPGEQFQEIRIVTMGEEDELKGITIEYKYNDRWIYPPQLYFSESHLNCLGLSFFLASVIAFNKENKFIILDDVISSFDTTHRKRFADLIFEKFSDYQIILMTHEEEWFQYLSKIAKSKNWIIKEIKWSNGKGTYIDSNPIEIKELIETNLTNGNVEFLGNPIRQYLEHMLKEICFNLRVKVDFRFNDFNERRMSEELLSELRSKINRASDELKAKTGIIERVAHSNILANLLSHDNDFCSRSGDVKAFWNDILEIENLFYCREKDCKKPISIKYYDNVAKKIRCGCGARTYDWRA